MTENSTFYFLKVELGIDTCEEVTAIERMKHGTEYLWLWIRLALKYANYGGVLCKRIGEVVFPVSVEDITAEMKGGFTDVSIKDGIATLIKGSLMYINTDGFMAITGLSITGDPKEPTLHKQNSNSPEVRPLSIGKDSKVAKYHRERRRQLKDQEEHLLLEAPRDNAMTYAEISKKAECSKQTVINTVKKWKLDAFLISDGQKKKVPYHISQFLIHTILHKPIPSHVQIALDAAGIITSESKDHTGEAFDGFDGEVDGLDGFDGLRQPSNTVKELSNQVSKLDSYPSSLQNENIDEMHGFDGFANANQDAMLDANFSLIESKEFKENKETDDDIETVKNRNENAELFSIAFDHEPDEMDLACIDDLKQKCSWELLTNALKATRKAHGETVAYTKKIVENCIAHKAFQEPVSTNNHSLPEEMDNAEMLNYAIETVLPGREKDIYQLKKYYSSKELINALKMMGIYQISDPEYLMFFLHNPGTGNLEEDERRLARFRMEMGSQRERRSVFGS